MNLRKYLKGKAPQKSIIVLDVGTTGVKALVFSLEEEVLARAYIPLKKHFPQPGHVEQDPFEYIAASRQAVQSVVRQAGLTAENTVGMGMANQRETVIAWHKDTGQPFYPAIVWEDVRTIEMCAAWQREFGEHIRNVTGLRTDPYFTASKIRWLFENVAEVRVAHAEGKLLCGTVDTWLLWNLLENKPHITDDTNASRTLLFNTREKVWDESLLEVLRVPREVLPTVRYSRSLFGMLKSEVVGFTVPLLAVCGDQQASMYAAGTATGTTKITFGTGTFIMQSIGSDFSLHEPFFTTLIPGQDQSLYGVECKIARGGREVEPLIEKTEELRALLYELAKEVDAYIKQLPTYPKELIIDGGVSRDEHIAEIQAEVSGLPVKKQKIFDGTALGVARLLASSLN